MAPRSRTPPRNRCLEFIKHLVKWENSNNPEYIEPARKLIAAAHKFLHPHSVGDAPASIHSLVVEQFRLNRCTGL